MRSPRDLAGGAPRGLVLTCGVVALIVLAPVVVTVVQALQGGVSSAANSVRASSSLTLLGHTALVALGGHPHLRGVRSRGRLVRRTDPTTGEAAVGASSRCPAGGAALRHLVCLRDARRVTHRFLRIGCDHRLLLLPHRLPAVRREPSGDGPRARGEQPFTRSRRVADLLAGGHATTAPCSLRRASARRPRRAGGVRRLRGIQVPDVHTRHLRPVPGEFQRIGCCRTLLLLRRPLRDRPRR